MQTILGAGGVIGIELARALTKYTSDIRLVARHPQKVNEGDETFQASLLDAKEVDNAVKGSEVAYLVAGLKYDAATWEHQWPLVMEHVITACLKHKCRLVFFDNLYLYDENLHNPITENSPVNPSSRKGIVRASIIDMLWQAVMKKGLEALVVRSADFYGPGIKQNSFLIEAVFKPLAKGETAHWLMRADVLHSFTYTPDAAIATALLGNSNEAYGETWHLPTAEHPKNGKQWVEMIAKALGVKPQYRVAGKWMMKILGFFNPIMKESIEMLYQYDRDYVFSSAKLEKRFGLKPTPYEVGIQAVAKEFKKIELLSF